CCFSAAEANLPTRPTIASVVSVKSHAVFDLIGEVSRVSHRFVIEIGLYHARMHRAIRGVLLAGPFRFSFWERVFGCHWLCQCSNEPGFCTSTGGASGTRAEPVASENCLL